MIGTGADDPQKLDPTSLAGDPRPLADVHLRRGSRGRGVGLAGARTRRSGPAAPRRSRSGSGSPPPRTRSGTAATSPPTPGRGRSGDASWSSSTTARVIEDEIAVADAHPLGARPFGRAEYIAKFQDAGRGDGRGGGTGELPGAGHPPALPRRRRTGQPHLHGQPTWRRGPRKEGSSDAPHQRLRRPSGAEPSAPGSPRDACCASRGRSRRSRRSSSRSSASRASTSRGPSSPPLSGCRTSASPRWARSPRGAMRSPG